MSKHFDVGYFVEKLGDGEAKLVTVEGEQAALDYSRGLESGDETLDERGDNRGRHGGQVFWTYAAVASNVVSRGIEIADPPDELVTEINALQPPRAAPPA
jgi:hypothetical protein